MTTTMNSNNVFFFLGGLDAEMVTIREVLLSASIPFCDKQLGWGAKASSYSEEIAQAVSDGKTPVLIELALDIELPESNIIVDHHNENAGKPASILQVLDLIGMEPTRHQQLIAANDSGFIPAMIAIGASSEEIAGVRLLDRSAQGITPDQEEEATRAIGCLEVINGVTVVRLAHSKCATVTDRLFDPNQEQRLLIISGDGESNFYGAAQLCRELQGEKTGTAPAPWDASQTIDTYSHFGGWIGGDLEAGYGFWGGKADQDEILNYVVEYFA